MSTQTQRIRTLRDWGTSSMYYMAYKEYIFKKNTIFTPVFPFHNPKEIFIAS